MRRSRLTHQGRGRGLRCAAAAGPGDQRRPSATDEFWRAQPHLALIGCCHRRNSDGMLEALGMNLHIAVPFLGVVEPPQLSMAFSSRKHAL
jgi:hypothetical protein